MKLLSYVQNLPLNTRIKIMWISVVIVAIILVGVWFYTLKQQVQNTDFSDLPNLNQNQTTNQPESINAETGYASVEWVDRTDGTLKIYFKINNPTNNILSLSRKDQVTLVSDNLSQEASLLTDRQGNPFAQKALSQSENYGVATFEDPSQDTATIRFDSLYFENQPSQFFFEEKKLDLDKLNKPIDLRF